MLTVEQARERILSFFQPLQRRVLPLSEALGLTLAEELTAQFNLPRTPNSSMDGYALRSSDVKEVAQNGKSVLPVAGTIHAGDPPGRDLPPNSAIRIMTGAPIPKGADAVAQFEITDELERDSLSESQIGICETVHPGQNIRAAGEDMKEGDLILSKGVRMEPQHIAAAAALGRDKVAVFRRPRIAIISTGSEITEPGKPLQPGQIYDSNAYALAAYAAMWGAEPNVMGIVPDNLEAVQERLKAAATSSDMIVTSAGVSKGDLDVVKEALLKNGKMNFWSVKMRPAKPLAFGLLKAQNGNTTPHIGLPGNPVSAQVAFIQFGRPAIRKMQGFPYLPLPRIRALLDNPIHNPDGRRTYARVTIYKKDDIVRATTTGTQSSGVLTSMVKADGFAVCPEDTSILDPGTEVEIEIAASREKLEKMLMLVSGKA